MHRKSTRPAGARATLRLRIPPRPKYGKYVRERIAAFVATRGIPIADSEEFISAVSEALANAIEHSRSKDVEVSCSILGHERLVATIVDHGIGFVSDVATRLPDPLAERGRGLPLMRRFTDDLAVTSTPGKGTAVTLGRTIRYPVTIAG
jgi:anti-sigma regulatory factor (Ser/Thr protein kinase)